MLVTILPFFLAARVAVDQDPYGDSRWLHYGPECTYDVLVNMSLANIVHERDNFCSMIASELKCRPRGSDSLSCRFVNPRIRRPEESETRCSNARDFVPVSDRFVDADPFEIRFNSRGIENLIVSRSIPRWRLDMIRVIVGQLNVGVEPEKAHHRYITMENSTIGYCEVEVKVSRLGYARNRPRAGALDAVDITFEPERPDIVPLNRAMMQIQKTRQPKRCPSRKVYFFGNHRDFSLGHKSTYMDMTTSVSQIRIAEDEFYSYTEATGIMKTRDRRRTMRLYQKIELRLKSIDHAWSPIPEIRSPASTSLYAYTNLDRSAETR